MAGRAKLPTLPAEVGHRLIHRSNLAEAEVTGPALEHHLPPSTCHTAPTKYKAMKEKRQRDVEMAATFLRR
jgi:hypothetical protein